ncbi:protein kinase [Colletotrichum melonis]|uniref:Protein kinase n=1 Tax=Colletotrichum melonis TaxID=1209925 RepID=A0AAI9XM61_9PEZI|nr:protein kinase [Colletotrichum melonis]
MPQSASNADCQCDSQRCHHCVGAARDELSHTLLRISQKDVNDSRNRFIPRRRLISGINYSDVSRWLSTCLPSSVDITSIESIARQISPEGESCCRCGTHLCTGLRITFACLMLLGRERYIVPIQRSQHNICDSTWPLDGSTADCPAASDLRNILKSLEGTEEELFIHLQWQMRSPYFRSLTPTSPDFGHFIIQDQVSLPWTTTAEEEGMRDGKLSSVHKIGIHADHCEFEAEGKSFALKILERGKVLAAAEKAFNKETAANQRATHPRITPLLAAFKHRNKFYLLFPWANGRNLQHLWSVYEPYPGLGGEPALWFSPQWMANQCYNIADALATVHGQPSKEGGYSIQAQLHHDIKPENILCFDDFENGSNTYKLKLTDFGLSLPTDSQSTLQPRQIAETKSYRPPETDIGAPSLGQKWDVWCLGCLYLDFITWAVLGWSGVEAFEEARVEIDETDPGGSTMEEDVFFVKRRVTKRGWCLGGATNKIVAAIKPSVTSHMQDLRDHPECSPALAGFLDYIRSKMLVIESNERDSSSEVRDFLHIWMSNQVNS